MDYLLPLVYDELNRHEEARTVRECHDAAAALRRTFDRNPTDL